MTGWRTRNAIIPDQPGQGRSLAALAKCKVGISAELYRRAKLFAESEHSHSHHNGTGIRWLDMVVAVSAMFVSVVSLVVSIGHGRTMERMVKENARMVAGSTMPFLTWAGGMYDPVTNQRHLRLILKNGGVGPARVDWFELRYKGVPYGSVDDLLHHCCGAALQKDKSGHGVFYANVSGSMIPQRESVDVVELAPEVDPALWHALQDARSDITVRACYCSVLDECWEATFGSSIGSAKRVPVNKCTMPANNVLW